MLYSLNVLCLWAMVPIRRLMQLYLNTIISNNITELVSHNVICFGCFMSMSHGAKKKAATIFPSSPDHVFTRFVCCFTRKTLSLLFCFDLKDYCIKIMHFQNKIFFRFQLIAGRFWFYYFIHMCFTKNKVASHFRVTVFVASHF